MSVIHKIISKRPLNMSSLNAFVSTIEGAICECRGEKTLFFWINGQSTRGFDIIFESSFIAVRNTILSNRVDYELTNKIVAEILTLTGGIILNEEDEEMSNFSIFDNDKITETEIHDCELIYTLLKEHDITIEGPLRKVYFGKRLHQDFSSLQGEQLKNKIFDLLLTVNYGLPDYESGNVISVNNPENDDEQKIMKIVFNKTDNIIEKYDYILLYQQDRPIMITNEILNTMLPSNWTLADEYTIVAPVINQREWKKLLYNAKKQDLWDIFTGRNVNTG